MNTRFFTVTSLLVFANIACASVDSQRAVVGPYGIPIPFIENRGQIDDTIAYYLRMTSGDMFVNKNGELTYSMISNIDKKERVLFSEQFLNNSKFSPRGSEQAATKLAFFQPNKKGGSQAGVRSFRKIDFKKVWKGIDVVLRANNTSVEKLFVLQPNADPNHIVIKIKGAKKILIEDSGELLIRHKSGDYHFTQPFAYQQKGDKIVSVQVSYRTTGHRYGFKLGTYDTRYPVIIDPILQATFISGSGPEWETDLVYDAITDKVYVSADTVSDDLPNTAGGAQETGSGGNIMIARLSSDLTTLEQVTYFGGSLGEREASIRIHPNAPGDIYLVGRTLSDDIPGTTISSGGQSEGAIATKPTPGNDRKEDIFIARFNAGLTELKQATYLGGTAEDMYPMMEIHPGSGDIYVAGTTFSAFSTIPAMSITGGAYTTSLQQLYQGFVSRVSADLTTVKQSTYVGGQLNEINTLLTIADDGSLYVGGVTQSTDLDDVTGGFQETHAGGGEDSFIYHLSENLQSSLGATYIGGSGEDWIHDLLFDSASGKLYVSITSDSANLPGTVGGAQPDNAGGKDAYIGLISSDLSTLERATYLGGSLYDRAPVLALHPSNDELYVAMTSSSLDMPSLEGGIQPERDTWGGDLYVARMGLDLTEIKQATFIGGRGSLNLSIPDLSAGLDFNTVTGNVYLSGAASTVGALQPGTYPGTTGGAQAARMNAPGTMPDDHQYTVDSYIVMLNAELTSDTTPAPYNFAARKDAPFSTEIMSNPITIEDVDGWAMIDIEPDNYASGYSIDSGPFYNSPGFVTGGQTVVVKQLSSSLAGSEQVVTLTIGRISANFSVTTENADITPDLFSFDPVIGAISGSQVTSNTIIVSGINQEAPISVKDAHYSIDNGGLTSTPRSISVGQSVRLHVVASSIPGETRVGSLTIGDVTADFSVTSAELGDNNNDNNSSNGSSGGGSISFYWSIFILGIFSKKYFRNCMS